MDQEFPEIVVVKPGDTFVPPEPLSDYDIQMIHTGLLVPNAKAIHSMAREIRKWRGVTDPDSV